MRPRTRAALAAARAAGIRILIVTGRMFRSARPFALAAGVSDPIICYQGALVAEPDSGRVLHHVGIPVPVAREAIGAVEERAFDVNCYVDDELVVARRTRSTDAYLEVQGVPIDVREVGDLRRWLSREPTKLVTVADPAALAPLELELKARFGERLYVARSLPQFLELTAQGVTKHAGLEAVARATGLRPDRTVAFGDGENDLELLRWAGYAVAVANAHAAVLAQADLVCPSVEEEGVAQVIEAYLDSRA
ncbi:MAG: Cof-type HAD-IIB family hydrolase [Thermoleophilia bacterium]|nr:Cof-type HAD-IIB family hydrolase [Thermoleophilia bacterium]